MTTTAPATKSEMIAVLLDRGRSRGLASGAVNVVIRDHIRNTDTPNWDAALTALDALRPLAPEKPAQPDWGRQLRATGQITHVNTEKRATTIFAGKSTPSLAYLTFDRQMMYARYGRLSVGERARLRQIEQRLAVVA